MEDIKATHCDSDAIAREILADLAGGTVDDSTSSLVQKIIFGDVNDETTAKCRSNALKIAVNGVYGDRRVCDEY